MPVISIYNFWWHFCRLCGSPRAWESQAAQEEQGFTRWTDTSGMCGTTLIPLPFLSASSLNAAGTGVPAAERILNAGTGESGLPLL